LLQGSFAKFNDDDEDDEYEYDYTASPGTAFGVMAET